MNDPDDAFQNTVAGQFSALEQQMGREAYEANVEGAKANVAAMIAHARRTSSQALLISNVAWGLLIASIPVDVWLWRWAL